MSYVRRIMPFLALAGLLAVVALAEARPARAQTTTLGSIVITVGASGTSYGFDSGSYGTLDSGEFPGDLFDDGNARTVAAIYEDADGYWYFTYSGGTANDWLSAQEQLDEITVAVTYEDGLDNRSFVVGGFVNSRPGSRGLRLEPPLPSRDWNSRNGEEVDFEFFRHATQQPATPHTGVITDPTADADSWAEWISETTPGGPVVAQWLIVLLVYATWMVKKSHSTKSLLAGAVVLVLTPWLPYIFNIGTPIAAVINMVNLALGAYVYKYYFAKNEEYR